MAILFREIDPRQFFLSGASIASTGVANTPGDYLVISPEVIQNLGGSKSSTIAAATLASSALRQSGFDPQQPAADFAASSWANRNWTDPSSDRSTWKSELETWVTNNLDNATLNPGARDYNFYLVDVTLSGTRYFLPILYIGSPIDPIITNGLQLYLDAGNPASYPGTGTLWTDLSGNNYHGTLVNGVGYHSGNGGSLTFDGNNDWVSTDYYGVTGQTPRTVSAWFYPNVLQSRNLLGWGSQTNNRMWDQLLLGANIGVHVYNSGSEAGAAYSASTWQQITFTYTHPTIRSYMNAIYKNQYTNNFLNTGNSEKFNIARGLYTNYAHFNGRVAQVLVYNRELSAAEINTNFQATRARFNV